MAAKAKAVEKAAPMNEMQKLKLAAIKKYDMRVDTMAEMNLDVPSISVGNMAIDYIIGVGGLPFGYSVELYGPPSSGKTTTALMAAAELQKVIKAGGDPSRGIGPNDYILFLDYEFALQESYANALGIDTHHESWAFAQPDTLEAGANFAMDAIKTGLVRMLIIDSVAAMNPSSKAEAEIGKSLPAVQAKLLKDFGNNMNAILKQNNTVAIYLNHLVEVMDMGAARRPGMPPRTSTPGGMALKYYSSVRIKFTQIKQNKTPYIDELTKEEKTRVTSTDVKVLVEKNKVANPFREAIVRVRFGRGFDNLWTALQVLLAHKHIMYNQGRYYFHKLDDYGMAPEWMAREKTGTQRPYIHGADSLFEGADTDPEWRTALIMFAEEVVRSVGGSMKEVVSQQDPDESVTEGEAAEDDTEDLLKIEEKTPETV